MKKSSAIKVLIGLVGSALLSAPAMAGDWNYAAPGLKDWRGSAVPVPAPAPVPVYDAKWYFRADAAIGIFQKPSSTLSGLTYGQNDGPGPASDPTSGPAPFSFGTGSFTSVSTDNNFGGIGVFGVGVGYYWSPSLRFDLTAEGRTSGEVQKNGTYQYLQHSGGIGTWAADPNTQVNGTVHDRTSLSSGIFLANAYYDMGHFRGFTPYVGAGVGFAVNELVRRNTTGEYTCDPGVTCGIGTPVTTYTTTQDKDHTISLAAALTAGFAYEVSKGTYLDFNYRYIYTTGTSASLTIDGNPSKMDIEGLHEHHLRAGVRFDIE